MEHFRRNDVQSVMQPGRWIQAAIGRESFCQSERMTMRFAHNSDDAGSMPVHQHAEESIYIIDAMHGWVEWGAEEHDLRHKLDLAPGMVLHFPENEWHVFNNAEGGFVDMICVYAPPI